MRNVISRVKGSQPAPILLVANKLDLDCQREVSTAEGKLCSTSNQHIRLLFLVSQHSQRWVLLVEYHSEINSL